MTEVILRSQSSTQISFWSLKKKTKQKKVLAHLCLPESAVELDRNNKVQKPCYYFYMKFLIMHMLFLMNLYLLHQKECKRWFPPFFFLKHVCVCMYCVSMYLGMVHSLPQIFYIVLTFYLCQFLLCCCELWAVLVVSVTFHLHSHLIIEKKIIQTFLPLSVLV